MKLSLFLKSCTGYSGVV